MSKILCIIDGMTDPQFRAGDYPNLASMQHANAMDTGTPPESLGCILRILGVKQVPDHLRGYAEALGEGIPVQDDDLVLRGSWFALDGDGVCTVPVQGDVPPNLPAFCRYYRLEQYKSLLVFPGLAACVQEITTFPPYGCVGKRAESLCPTGHESLRGVFSACLTKKRCLVPWGQSVPVKLPPFPERAAVVCGTTIVKGIARLLDMTLIDVPHATGDVDTDLRAKCAAALEAAESYPFVLLHIGGTDEASHRKDAAEKREFLRKIDGEVLAPLLASSHEIVVMSDHGTDPETGLHLAGPQPVFTNP